MNFPKSSFKVYYKDIKIVDLTDFSLVFFTEPQNQPLLEDFHQFILKYNDLIAKKKGKMHQLIKEIIPYGNASKDGITQFYSLLLTKQGKKYGYLVGNEKNNGFKILGVWPLQEEDYSTRIREISEDLSQIIQNPDIYENILLLS